MNTEWRALSNNEEVDTGLSLHPIVQKILKSRGYDDEEKIVSFVKASLKDMKSPYLLKDMEVLVSRFYQAFERQESILIYGDFDLDGTSGVASLVSGLKALGFQHISYYQPKRLSEGYGLHQTLMSQFKDEGVDLVLSVDVGITAIEAAKKAKEIGLDLIISDHHQPKEVLPDALAVVNPNRKDCLSGLEYLCGAGVAYYILLALKMYWDKNNISHNFSPKDILEYFIIGTLTDMVPLINENRALTKHGMLSLQNTDKAGLRVLLESLNFWGRPLSSQDIAIGMAPKLNALSRMERGLLPIDIMLEDSESNALKKMQEILDLNDLRKSLQKEAEEEAEAEFLAGTNHKFAFVYSKNFHKGVIGLVATKLANKYNVPAFVGTINEEGNIVGSARAPNIEIFSLLKAYEATSEHMLGSGGHHFASGFQIKVEKANDWRKALEDYYVDLPTVNVEIPYDLEVDLKDLDLKLMRSLDQLQPFGKGFPVPVFRIKGCKLSSKKVLRGGHLRLQLTKGKDSKTALYFSPPTHRLNFEEGDLLDLLVELQWNYFNGRKSLQLLVKDLVLYEA